MSTIPLVELRDICDREAAHADAAFAALGRWVASTDEPELQRAFATAAHRSAWHADLWRSRFPVVQQLAERHPPGVEPLVGDDDRSRRTAAMDAFSVTLERLRVVADRVDDVLDPSTARVVGLVTTDLRDVLDSLADS